MKVKIMGAWISEEQLARFAEEASKRPLRLTREEFVRLETSAREWADLVDGPRPRLRDRLRAWLRGLLS